MRETGFYWVKYSTCKALEVAAFVFGRGWMLVGISGFVSDKHLEWIDENPIKEPEGV